MNIKVCLDNQPFGNIRFMEPIQNQTSNFNSIKCEFILMGDDYRFNEQFYIDKISFKTLKFDGFNMEFELKSMTPLEEVEKNGEIKFQLKKEYSYEDLKNSIEPESKEKIFKLLLESHRYFD